MGVMGVSSSQRLLQSQVVQALADKSSHPFVPFNAIVTVTSCDQDLLDIAKLSAMLDDNCTSFCGLLLHISWKQAQ